MSWLLLPKCAFVVFESETGYNLMADAGDLMVSGLKSKVTEAPEPTNVIWENRDFDK